MHDLERRQGAPCGDEGATGNPVDGDPPARPQPENRAVRPDRVDRVAGVTALRRNAEQWPVGRDTAEELGRVVQPLQSQAVRAALDLSRSRRHGARMLSKLMTVIYN
jgi:hypothetical protein